MKKKVLFFLASEKGYSVIKSLIEKNYKDNIGAVITFQERDVEKSWHEDIIKICKENHIECYLWSGIRERLSDYIAHGNFCTAITVSWIYLLPLDINKYFDYDFIVIHDSLLPKYRGFAPTPTAIINGEKLIGLTALFATDDMDNGDIIDQISLEVDDNMYIKEIIEALAELYGIIICRIMKKITSGEKLESTPQDEKFATYSIWRNVEDCRIDWSQSSVRIYNFIRAVGRPYPGAFSIYDGRKIIIEKSEIIGEKKFEIRDFGKIWSIKSNCPEVICGEGMLRILEAEYEDGTKVEFKKLRCRFE